MLRAIYLTFSEGHWPHGTGAVVRDDLCEEALRLARGLHRLLPHEPEVTGLLALILLTSARSAARADQDRSRWDRGRLAEGRSLAEAALAQRRPGSYQLRAAIAACHADAATAACAPRRRSARELASLYEVSARTIERDIGAAAGRGAGLRRYRAVRRLHRGQVTDASAAGRIRGIFDTGGEFPDHAIFVVVVQDVAAVCAQVERLGGKVLVPPTTSKDGLVFADLHDPAGNHFGVFTPPPA